MKIFAPICAVLMLCAFDAQAQDRGQLSGATIAVVSGQRISQESAAGKAGVARMQALQRERADGLRTRQETLNTTRAELAKASDAPTRTRLQQQESVQRSDLERATAQLTADLQSLQRQISSEIQVKVRSALDEVLKGRDVAVVLQQETAVVWSAPGLDLTDEVIAVMDKADESAPKPSGAQ